MVSRTSPCLELGVDILAERIKCSPGFLVERLCDARVLGHPVNAHVEG
jgi:hypothetical protein